MTYVHTVHCALHCTALHCTALHCTALHCTALHCTALHCTALHCMPCTAVLPGNSPAMTRGDWWGRGARTAGRAAPGDPPGHGAGPTGVCVKVSNISTMCTNARPGSFLQAGGGSGPVAGAPAPHCTALHCTALHHTSPREGGMMGPIRMQNASLITAVLAQHFKVIYRPQKKFTGVENG
jgi:hypothetical protein